MKHIIVTLALIVATALGQSSVRAEDIDIFTGTPASVNAPNVLFIIDNTANWSQAFTNEMAALAGTFNGLPVNTDGSAKFNVGIMFANETGNPNNNTGGGYVRAAVRSITSVNRGLYAAMISNFDQLKDKGNSGHSALQMAEAYLYFSGGVPYAGNGKVKTDFSGNVCIGCGLAPTQTAADAAVYALPGNALSSEYAASYHSPVTSGCAKNFIIYISNGANQDSSSVDSQANAMLAAAGGSTTTLPISPSGSMSNPSDEWARFMKKSTLGVVTYAIDVDPVTSGQGPGWTQLLKSMAAVSSGKYSAVDSSVGGSIAAAITGALSEILAVNGVFASVSLPVSVNTQGTYLNQVFVGMFRPDANANPRWMGNLKQYQMGFIGTALSLEDADSKGAINNQTGFITECARSFWTPSTTDAYWSFNPQGGCIPAAGLASDIYLNSNYPDGNIVEKGGEGYLLRGNTARTMYTCASTFSACTLFTTFGTGNSAITPALLGVSTSSQATALIQWERGLDMLDENSNGVTTAEMRPSAHGDVVHSRPAAINFGSDASPQVVIFYGGNDGAFRAINGNQTAGIGSVLPGAELWSFVPPEFYGSIQRLYNDTTQISYPNVTSSGALPKPYGIDGPSSAYRDASHTWIYAPMRRGGRVLYAFDVTTPASPQIKWKRGCPNNFPKSGTVDDTGCTTGFSGMGQAWPSATPVKASGYGSGSSPMLIMGGGYDTCEDSDPNTCTASTKGNRVYVLDADTGGLLNTFTTARAVVADVTVVHDGSTGLAIYAYAVDLGGDIYRINMGSNAPSSWTMTQIASLGCSTTTTCAANRKFMFAADAVLQNGIYTLLLGSGDREKPLLYTSASSKVNTVSNYFFAVQDNPSSSTWLSSESANCAGAMLCLSSLLPISSSAAPSASALAAKKGWYMSLDSTEQVVTAAITIYGTIYFSTNQPSVANPTSCTTTASLGITRLYTVPFSAPAITRVVLPPVGLPPSPVAGVVQVGNDGRTVPFCMGCSPDSPLQSTQPQAAAGTVPAQPKSRVYWYIQR
jgi:type IV pilus assembly protein PilY1